MHLLASSSTARRFLVQFIVRPKPRPFKNFSLLVIKLSDDESLSVSEQVSIDCFLPTKEDILN